MVAGHPLLPAVQARLPAQLLVVMFAVARNLADVTTPFVGSTSQMSRAADRRLLVRVPVARGGWDGGRGIDDTQSRKSGAEGC